MRRFFNLLPVWILILGFIMLFIDVLCKYNSPFYGDGENPEILDIKTYIAGKNQLTHPSLFDFGYKRNGYRYWMAYSPYPFACGEEENPCIAVSNDLKTWTTPNGLHNPIAYNEETSCDELKDPHIVYNTATDSLEMWYLGRIDGTISSGADLIQFRKRSADGIRWENYEVLHIINGAVSPSIIFDKGKYKYWTIKPSSGNSHGELIYAESPDGYNWSDFIKCKFNGQLQLTDIWHGAVSKDSIFRFVYVEHPTRSDRIMYTESNDGLNWSAPIETIKKGIIRNRFYRPCILASNDSVYCVYGVVDQNNVWNLALTTSDTPYAFDNKPVFSKFSVLSTYYKHLIKHLILKLNGWANYVVAFVVTLIFGCISYFREKPMSLWITSWSIIFCLYLFRIEHNLLGLSLLVILTWLISLISMLSTIGFQSLIKRM